jgi:methyl-accepting chemotaxis protein
MEQIRDASQKVKDMIGTLAESMSQQVSAIHQLASALTNVSEMSQSISAATEEQTTNAKQVAKAVENVNDLTQSAASAAEEMSAATEQMSTMAQELQGLMAQFKIAADGDRHTTVQTASAFKPPHTTRGVGTKTAAVPPAVTGHSNILHKEVTGIN